MNPKQFASCMEACMRCALACHHCSAACLNERPVEPMARCIALDMDCAAMCELAAAAMARDSENARALCRLCAQICEICGDECGKHDMDHCRICAQECHACAAECLRMQAAAT
jgi:hypothetical protein